MSNEIQILENLRASHIKLLHDQPDLITKINNQYDLVKERINGPKKCKAVYVDEVYRCESCGKPVGIFAKFCEHCTCELDWEPNYVR